jgi:putative transposase
MPSDLPGRRLVALPKARRLPAFLWFEVIAQSCYNRRVKQVIALKLEPSPEQVKALLAVMEAFNAAANFVAALAFEKRISNKLVIQPLVYSEIRTRFNLSSQLAIRAIAKAIEAYKRDKTIQPTFKPHGAIVYDERILAYKGLTHVSLMTLSGRETIPLRFGAYQEARLGRVKGQADLVYREGRFYLYATIEMPTPPPVEPVDVLGVDLGMELLAADSDGETFSGAQVKAVRRRYHRLRQGLQQCGSKSAKRHLKKIKRKESRFRSWVNHNISRRIVDKLRQSHKALSLETLKGINQRNTVRRGQRAERLSWAFDQLKNYLCYKCAAAGIRVYLIDPAYTSRTCLACGHCSKSNRRSQSEFVCVECGFFANADYVGASNIRLRGLEARAAVTRPLVAALP